MVIIMENSYCTLKGSKLIWKIYKVDKNKVYLEMNNKKMVTDINNIVLLNDYIPVTVLPPDDIVHQEAGDYIFRNQISALLSDEQPFHPP